MLELRAGLVLTHGVATAQRLFIYREKLAPEVRAYLKGLPDAEQPISLAGMHRAVRKWAEIQREGQSEVKWGKWEREHMHDLTEDTKRSKKEKQKEKKAKEAAEKKQREQEATGRGQSAEYVAALAQVAQDLQAFMTKVQAIKAPEKGAHHRLDLRRIGPRKHVGSVAECI